MLLFLIQNVDVFAWSPYKVLGVDPEFIVHKLNVDSSFPPKKQKPSRSAKEHVEAIRSEVRRLREARAIRETFFSGMAGKYRGYEEKEWQVEGLRRFHGLEPGMSKRPISNVENRPTGRCHIWTPGNEFLGFLSRVSLDRPGTQRPGKDGIHLPGCKLPLYRDAFWAEKCWGHISTDDDKDVS